MTPTAEAERALALFLAGKNTSEIVLALRGLKSNQSGRYQVALKEIHNLLRAALAARGLAPTLAEQDER